jgi:hypothetical protein
MKQVIAVVLVLGFLLLLPFLGRLVEFVPADSIAVIQYPSGTLKVIAQPGPTPQWMGEVTYYKKSTQAWFSAKDDQGSEKDDAIKCRFSEGGHAMISGGVRLDFPVSTEQMILLHTKFGSQKAVMHELIRTSLERAVYMSGPLMTSQESSAEKRPLLLTYIEDQASNGVYSTHVKETKQPDPVTGEMKTVSVVEIAVEAKTGAPTRLEDSPLKQFGLRLYGLSINEVAYDAIVEGQIKQQQEAKMAVQIALANSKKAEQDSLTAAKVGEAAAMKAKWAQEEIKSTEVTKAEKDQKVAQIKAEQEATVAKIGAEKELAVATLAKQAAEQTKLKDIALGEGESTRMKLVMEANGALELKLKAYEAVQAKYAESLAQFKGNLVPTVVMGSQGSQQTSAVDLISMLTAKTAKDLALDMSMPASKSTVSEVAIPSANK